MPLGISIIATFFSLICRGIIFQKRDVSWFCTLIPGFNKYKLGKLAGTKKLGIINAIAHTITYLISVIYIGFEFYLIQTYADKAYLSKDGTSAITTIQVPAEAAELATFLKNAFIVCGIITMILWCMMMWKFTLLHKKSPWWILLWAMCPIIPYIYFAAIPEMVIDGKHYILQRVEVANKKR